MTPATIFTAIADAFSIPADSITGPARPRNISDGRHLAAWIMRHHCRMSNAQVAVALGRKCHGAATHCVQRATDLMATDKHYRRCAQTVFRTLGLDQQGVAA